MLWEYLIQHTITFLHFNLLKAMPSFTEANFTSYGNEGGPTFTSNDPLTLPASAAGKTISVTLSAQDSRGLNANPISFTIMVVDTGTP